MKQHVIELFHRSIEAKMTVGEELSGPLILAAERLTSQLSQGNKILSCGEGLSNALAATFTRCLTHGYHMERPGFPALTLYGESSPGDLHDSKTNTSPYTQALNVLGAEGDVLVIFSAGYSGLSLLGAIETAKNQNMVVIAFTANGDRALSHLLDGNDIELHVANDDQYRIQEIQQLCLFCLCDLIEAHLFGEEILCLIQHAQHMSWLFY